MNENVRGHRTLHPGEVELVAFDSAAEIDTKKETESLIEIHEGYRNFQRTKSADISSDKEGSHSLVRHSCWIHSPPAFGRFSLCS